MTFCDNLLKSFSENLKQLTKINDFLLFLRFHENRTNSTKNMLIRVFLHAEFISPMKTVQNPTIFMKNARK